MLILAFETSGPTASIALMKDGALLAEYAVHHTRTHSETVMPMVQRLMQELDFAPEQIGALAVNKGPGSFTGVRIGVSTVNAMAAALDIPAIGICSLEALYENVSVWPGHACVLIDARNENAYAAQFTNGHMIGEPEAVVVPEYVRTMPVGTLYVGDGAHAYRACIEQEADGPVFAQASLSLSRASALLNIADVRLKQEYTYGVRVVEPLYLRPSQAERMWAIKHGEMNERDGNGTNKME